jgi:hypothetical protein
MTCKACNETDCTSTTNGICAPCWENFEQVEKALKEWKPLGGDLEGRLNGDGYVDIRVDGGDTELFLSKSALEAALALFTLGQ